MYHFNKWFYKGGKIMCLSIFKKSLEEKFIRYAKADKKIIALPEAEFSGLIIKAAENCTKRGIAKIVLIGDEQKIKNTFLHADFKGITFINPKAYDQTKDLAQKLYESRKNKGLQLKEAKKLILDPIYFATMLLQEGLVDGVVGGAATTTKKMLKPALQIIKTQVGFDTVSSSFIMISKEKGRIGDKGVFVVGDCALNVNPDSAQLADIALATAETAKNLAKLDPRVALLSYSTHGSSTGESAKKVKEATKLAKDKRPELNIEGELQADSALVPHIARVKVTKSDFTGDANVLIFPDLNSGNIAYKLIKVASKTKAIGPIMQGLNKPVNDLSRGASVNEIVLTIAITSLQASNLSEEERQEKIKNEKLAKKQAKLERKGLKKEKKKAEKNKKEEIKEQEEELEEDIKEQEEKVEEQKEDIKALEEELQEDEKKEVDKSKENNKDEHTKTSKKDEKKK
jgi:phosphate acetyltransferase